jgi:rhamnose transport system permease protein
MSAAVDSAASSVRGSLALNLMRLRTFIALFAVLIFFAFAAPNFLHTANLVLMSKHVALNAFLAIGMTFVIITGGIDLSVGSTLGLVAILLGVLWHNVGLPLPLAMVLGVAAGGLAGLGNGFVITRFRVPPLIATLATLALYRGLAEGISQARSVRGYPEWFYVLGQGDAAGVPVQLWVFLAAALLAGFILTFTTFGRTTYAVGANEVAARFSGLHVDRAKLLIYTASGLVAGLAAVIFVSRVSTTRSDMGTGVELDAITAVVLGGTSIFGGRGTIVGTVLGLILIQVLKNGLALSGVKGDGTIVVIGAVLIASTLLSNLFRRDGNG